MAQRARVEVLFFEGCPHHPAAVSLVREVAAEMGVETELHEVAVRDAAAAERLRFPGSPTVRVNGADVEPGGAEPSGYALGCRLYAGDGVPSRDKVAEALRDATAGAGQKEVP